MTKLEVEQTALKEFRTGRFKKNILYTDLPESKELYDWIVTAEGTAASCSYILQHAHRKIGSQMQIRKEVTDDLQSIDFTEACEVEDIPWPSQCIEFYFEDPLLPTILMMKISAAQLEAMFPYLKAGAGFTNIMGLMQEGNTLETAMHCCMQLEPSMYKDFLMEGEITSMRGGVMTHKLSIEDNCCMSYMLQLTLKVLVFISIPKYKPALVKSKKEMHFGGKPGIQGRPLRPSHLVHYLPHIIREKDEQQHSEIRKNKQFRGRRGHIHWYRSEKFTKRKGTFDIFEPLKDPVTGKYPEVKTLYKVRKP